MTRYIDIQVFVDILENEGCSIILSNTHSDEGYESARVISPCKNRHSTILMSDEFITERVGNSILRELSMDNLIALIPYKELVISAPPIFPTSGNESVNETL